MNKFKESLKVDLSEKEQREYEEYKRKRFAKEVQKRDFKIQTIITVIVSILAIIVCFKAMSLAIDYEALEKEKQALEDTVEKYMWEK